jgi:dihydrofolate reductase
MGRLTVFNLMTLDGYIADRKGDMSWAHRARGDAEWDSFVETNARGGGMLVLGRITYELMAAYWPTPIAMKNDPVVADRMNRLPKIVFSWTLREVSWNNTRLAKGDVAAEVRRLKKEQGEDMAILGSGSIVSQLASEGLIDEYQVAVCPVVLGSGKTMFDGVKGRFNLKLIRTRTFANGNVLLCYEPAA